MDDPICQSEERKSRMTEKQYQEIENYMLSCMEDSAHDKNHVYRVLYTALEIAEQEEAVDYDILIAACLLHDVGRKEQFENPVLCHAQVGGEKAFEFLISLGWPQLRASLVRDCIATHRYRSENPPRSLEGKILFDADKIDVTGALGIARTLIYNGEVGEPIYTLDSEGEVSDGSGTSESSFFKEYQVKLRHIYDGFFTKTGAKIAGKRRQTAEKFYKALLCEVRTSNREGKGRLAEIMKAAEV